MHRRTAASVFDMKIIFVCTGNTCRSPMAEGYLKSLMLPGVEVQSRGLSAGGYKVSDNSVIAMQKYGIDIKDHISKPFTVNDFDADFIICMTDSHKNALISAGANAQKTIVLGHGIPDPFGGDIATYQKTADCIIDAINGTVFGGGILPVSIRTATAEDIKAIEKIENTCFNDPWSENAIKESMQSKTEFFVAIKNEMVAGYIGISVIAGEGYITNVAVLPQYRKSGLGTMLLDRVISLRYQKDLQFVSLEVRVSNENAIKLYESLGFKTEGKRKGFYQNPKEDALIMTRRFQNLC